MNKKLKIILAVFAFITVSCVLLTLSIGYLPIIGKIIATSKISDYTNSNASVDYNSYDGKYTSNDGKVKYDLKNNMLEDLDMIENEREGFNQKYNDFIVSSIEAYDGKVSFPNEIDLWIKLDAKDVRKKYYKVYLISVHDNFSGSEEETQKRIKTILSDFLNFMKSSYDITSIQFVYVNKNVAFQLSLDSKRKELDLSKIDKHLKKREDILKSLEYLEWKKGLQD